MAVFLEVMNLYRPARRKTFGLSLLKGESPAAVVVRFVFQPEGSCYPPNAVQSCLNSRLLGILPIGTLRSPLRSPSPGRSSSWLTVSAAFFQSKASVTPINMKHRLLPILILSLAVWSTVPLGAQTIPDVRAVTTQTTTPSAEQWRAISRFGYGPSPQSAALVARQSGMSWALAELELAASASQQPPIIPQDLRGFESPIPVLHAAQAATFAARRLANRSSGVDAPSLSSGAPASGPLMSIGSQSTEAKKQSPLHDQVTLAHLDTWRLHACSQPQLEPPLLARMTEFWFNHFNVSVDKGFVKLYAGHYIVHAIRANALGRFEDLLLSSARHPAMLYFLDQEKSRAADAAVSGKNLAKSGPNENYARELLELHTLGVNGGYTQHDVKELARILTGWTVDTASDQGFRFVAAWHDKGAKELLGHRFEGNGEADGEAAIRLLARHPSTARRISLRLAQWFVSDSPPADLVTRLTERYLETEGDIGEVMKTLINSSEAWDAEMRLFKTPMDYACSVLASLGEAAEDKHIAAAHRFLRVAGQRLHAWPTPDGYGTSAVVWLSPEALVRRAEFALIAGRALHGAESLAPWLPFQTLQRIMREPDSLRAGLALASPAYMHK